jgi:gas vesicle protein
MPKTKEEQLQRLLSIFDPNTLTNEQFIQNFKKVIEYVKKIEQKNLKDLEKMSKTLNDATEKLKGDNSTELKNLKQQITSELQNTVLKTNTELQRKIEEVDRKLMEVRNGEDADEERVIQVVLDKLPEVLIIPTIDDLKNDVPMLAENIRDALELLQEEERLDASAIKGLKDYIKEHAPKGGGMMGGLRPANTGIETPSGDINGSNKVYTVNWPPEFITLNGQAIYADAGYTLGSSGGSLTITLDFAPQSGDVLRSHYKEV